jgi:hypothetical protein
MGMSNKMLYKYHDASAQKMASFQGEYTRRWSRDRDEAEKTRLRFGANRESSGGKDSMLNFLFQCDKPTSVSMELS